MDAPSILHPSFLGVHFTLGGGSQFVYRRVRFFSPLLMHPSVGETIILTSQTSLSVLPLFV